MFPWCGGMDAVFVMAGLGLHVMCMFTLRVIWSSSVTLHNVQSWQRENITEQEMKQPDLYFSCVQQRYNVLVTHLYFSDINLDDQVIESHLFYFPLMVNLLNLLNWHCWPLQAQHWKQAESDISTNPWITLSVLSSSSACTARLIQPIAWSNITCNAKGEIGNLLNLWKISWASPRPCAMLLFMAQESYRWLPLGCPTACRVFSIH